MAQQPAQVTRRLSIVGIGAGICAGLLGLGGGIVLVPGLAWATGMSRHVATATSLLAIIPIAVVATITYALAPGGAFDAPASGLLVAGSLIGALIGVWLNSRLSDRGLRIGFAVLVGLLGARLVVPLGFSGDSRVIALSAGTALILVVLGLVVGVLSGMLGVGGGAIIVAVMVLTLGTSQAFAQVVSLTSIIPTSMVGAAAYRRRGMLATRPGMIAGLLGAVAALPASFLALALPSAALRPVFGAFLLYTAASTVRAQLRASRRTTVVPAA